MSEVEIANKALGYLGAKQIVSLQQEQPNAITCERYFDSVRDEVLQLFDWSFARATATLETTVSPSPDFNPEWNNAFQLPTDFIQDRKVWNALEVIIDFEIQGTYVLTNEDTVYLKYTKIIENTGLFSPLFSTAFAYRLAIEIQELVTGGKNARLRARLESGLAYALSQAEKMDGRRQNKTDTSNDSWTNARR